MEIIIISIYCLSVLIITYTYVGYGVALYFILMINRRITKREKSYFNAGQFPEVVIIVAAYNEEDCIREKIHNTLSLNYPEGKLKFLFITDGSSDLTPSIVKEFPQIMHLHQPERLGKIAAIDRAIHFVQSPIIVFSDANTLLNKDAIINIVRHYKDPGVGAVAGEKRIVKKEIDTASGAGEGFYWKYESTLKKWDSELNTVVGAAGELFSMRADLFESVPTDTIIEDFYMTLRIAQKGYRVIYEPDAYAEEGPSESVKEELKRKIRIAAGGIQSIVRLAPLMNIFRYKMLSFQYISHRVLRWTLAPLALITCLLTNIMLVVMAPSTIFLMLLGLQVCFYVLAFAGYLLEKRKIKIKIFFVPYYFYIMNYAVLRGIIKYFKGSQSVIWEKAKRA